MAENWYILQNGKRHGPYTGAELKRQAATGHLLPIDLVIKDGMQKPVPAAKVKGLFSTAEPPRQSAPDDFAAATQQDQTASRRTASRPNRTMLYLVLAGCGLLAVVAITLLVLTSGRKQNTANGPDAAKSRGETAGTGRVGSGGKADPGADGKVDLPDFSRVDYTLDTGKVDYTKGPQGQPLVRSKGMTKNSGRGDVVVEWQGYKDENSEMVQHGLNVVFHRTGQKAEESYYFAGKQHGTIKTWYDSGETESSGLMKNHAKHGNWQFWYKNGKPLKEEGYLSGVKHGPETNWFKDGTKKEETTFVDGIEHGRLTMWWENGKKSTEIHIKQGVRHGTAIWWEKNGAVSMRLTFRDGKTSFDPTSGSIADFASANEVVFGGTRRQSLQTALDTYGKPVSGFAEVANLKTDTQKWVYRCTDGEATLRCTVVRNDFWKEPRMVDIWEVKKK